MDSETLYQMIGLLPGDIRKLRESREILPAARIESCVDGMTRPETAERSYQELREYLDAASREEGAPVRDISFDMLYCQLQSAARVRDRYEQMGISETVFADTMKCFTRFMDECEVRNGRRYFERGWWTYRQTSMQLFRLGALEYEMVQPEGRRAVSIHIPSDADMSARSVDASLKEAELFFRNYYPDYDGAEYFCHSWLLSPALLELLPETSNILSFRRRFDITKTDGGRSRSYMRWLFQAADDVADCDLPERTSLQRAAKTYLLNGGTIGEGYGTLRK